MVRGAAPWLAVAALPPAAPAAAPPLRTPTVAQMNAAHPCTDDPGAFTRTLASALGERPRLQRGLCLFRARFADEPPDPTLRERVVYMIGDSTMYTQFAALCFALGAVEERVGRSALPPPYDTPALQPHLCRGRLGAGAVAAVYHGAADLFPQAVRLMQEQAGRGELRPRAAPDV
eukprot:gene110-39929_t